jgi:hypothetical protein
MMFGYPGSVALQPASSRVSRRATFTFQSEYGKSEGAQKPALERKSKAKVDPPASATITSTEAESLGDTAWDAGTYLIKSADGNVLDKGKYVTIWKRENGQWKLHRDIFNSDLPVAKQ